MQFCGGCKCTGCVGQYSAYLVMREGVYVVQADAKVGFVLPHASAAVVRVKPQLNPTLQVHNLLELAVCVHYVLA